MLETRRRVLDRFGPSGGGNTLRPVCGCIVLMLGCALGSLEAFGVLRYGCSWNLCSGWCPYRPYISGEQGYIEGVLVSYGIGVLVGYNCASCIQGRSDSIPMPIEALGSLAQQVVPIYPVWSWSAQPTPCP